MSDSFVITIDLEKLRANFSRSENTIWTIDQVRKWLREHRFIEQGDEWLCEEILLQLIAKDEITNIDEM